MYSLYFPFHTQVVNWLNLYILGRSLIAVLTDSSSSSSWFSIFSSNRVIKIADVSLLKR